MSLRVVFMGTPDFALTSLSGLLESGHQVAMAVTQPDRKQGRGEKLASCEVKCFARANNIPVIQPERIREKQWVDILKGAGAEVFVTCAYGQILPREILSIPRLGCINVHASLLPKYRGASPISHAIINGEKETGVTTMMTDAGMDTGDILLQEKVDIPEDMDAGALHDLLKHKGAGLLLKTLDALEKGTLVKTSQENGKATYAPLLKREDGLINWKTDAKAIHDRVRGLHPWPGSHTFYKGKKIKILRTGHAMDSCPGEPGRILEISKDRLVIKCMPGVLYVYELQFENRCRMSAGQCGHNLEKGAILHAPGG